MILRQPTLEMYPRTLLWVPLSEIGVHARCFHTMNIVHLKVAIQVSNHAWAILLVSDPV